MCSVPIVSKGLLIHLRKEYPKGTLVKLVKMESEPRPLEEGAIGVVESVDDIGTLHVRWNDGRQLGLVYGIDQYLKEKGGSQ